MRRRWPGSGLTWRRPVLAACVAVLGAATGASRPALSEPGGLWLGERAGPAKAQPVAVFGADDRVSLPAKLQPLRESLGVLFNVRLRTVCTAFCVDAATIGTAAHCLFKTADDKPPRLADFWFARNYDQVRDYARIAGHETGAAAQSVMAGSFALSTAPPIDATKDWAFVRLSRPVCSKGVLEIESASTEQVVREAKAGKVFQISYHRDFVQWRPAYSKPCAVARSFAGVDWPTIAADFSAPETLLLHTCDTGGASSGSPLMMETPSGPKVIGINVGTYVQSKVLMQNGKVSQRLAADSIANTGVASVAFAEQVTAFKAARLLAGAAALREVQERLLQGGFYTGPADGTYGPALKQAVEVFEAAAGLTRTGIVSEDLLSRLRLGAATALPPAKAR